MLYRYQFNDELSRTNLITTNSDKFLIMEENITEGNFLTFSDEKPINPIQTTTKEVIELQQNQLTLMDAIATLYEGLSAKGSI